MSDRYRAVAGVVFVGVALTGYGQEEDKRRTLAAGFDRHLVKPIDLDILAALLDDLPG